jgi:hypothetical protein
MSDGVFFKGMRAYKPSEKAPEWIIANIVVSKAELNKTLADMEDEFRLTLKLSKGGNYYFGIDAKMDAEKEENMPPKKQEPEVIEDDLPF